MLFRPNAKWAFIIVTAMVVLGSCETLRAQQPVDTPNSPAPQSPAPATAPSVPSTSSVPQSHMIRALQRLNYVCEDDNKVIVRLRGSNARVIFNNRIYNMKQVQSGSGTKYSEGNMVWWSKGEQGFLQDESKTDKNQMLAKNCQLQKVGSKVEPTVSANTKDKISGTVTYLQRMAMPAEAEVLVQLQDVTSPDQGEKIVAEDRIAFGQRQVPIPFELKFDPTKIDAKHLYVVSARLFVGTQLRFMNSKQYRVLTQGHPAKADLVLTQVETAKDPNN